MEKYSQSKLNRVQRGKKRATYNIEKINTILDAGFLCYVNYIFEGKPISIPMAYARKENKLYLHGSTGNRVLKTILNSKETSITVMHLDGLVLARSGLHHSVNYRSAILFGNVTKIENNTEKTTILKQIVNQMIPNHWETLRPMHQQELDRTLVVAFTIETATAKIRADGVNDELEDYKLPIWAGVIPIKQIAEKPIADKGIPETMDTPNHIVAYYNQHKK